MKPLLTVSEQGFKKSHGVGGRSMDKVKSLNNEVVDFQGDEIRSKRYLEVNKIFR